MAELAALDQFKKSFIREYSKYLITCCQVSDCRPLGYLFFIFDNAIRIALKVPLIRILLSIGS